MSRMKKDSSTPGTSSARKPARKEHKRKRIKEMEDSDGDSDYDPRYYVLSNSLYYKHGLFINIIHLGHY